MEQILFILFLLFLGYILQFLDFPKNFSQALNLFIIYVSFPATILLQVPKISFDDSLLVLILIPYLVAALSVASVRLFFSGLPRNTQAALYLLLPLGNTSFFGFPILQALLGEDSIPYGIVYDQFGTFVLLSVYGSFVIAYFSGSIVTMRGIGKKIVTFPPFIFLIIALLFGELPSSMLPFAQILANTLVPLAIMSVGFSMRLAIKEDRGVFVRFMALKLFLIPLIVFLILFFLGFGGMVSIVALLESAMPSMITAGALAISSGFAPRLAASLVGYGILFGVASVTFWHTIGERFLG